MGFKEKFGNRLRNLRKERGFTQNSIVDALAERTSYTSDLPTSDKGWQSYEKGRTTPSLEGLAHISAFFGVTSDYLLGIDPEMKPGAKKFQQETGLSESAIANISKHRHNPEIISCINQFLSSDDFINAICNMVIAKSPYYAGIPTKEEITDSVLQGSKLYQIAIGKKESITDEHITLKGERLKEWQLWQASQNLNKLINRIVKGEDEDGTR